MYTFYGTFVTQKMTSNLSRSMRKLLYIFSITLRVPIRRNNIVAYSTLAYSCLMDLLNLSTYWPLKLSYVIYRQNQRVFKKDALQVLVIKSKKCHSILSLFVYVSWTLVLHIEFRSAKEISEWIGSDWILCNNYKPSILIRIEIEGSSFWNILSCDNKKCRNIERISFFKYVNQDCKTKLSNEIQICFFT